MNVSKLEQYLLGQNYGKTVVLGAAIASAIVMFYDGCAKKPVPQYTLINGKTYRCEQVGPRNVCEEYKN